MMLDRLHPILVHFPIALLTVGFAFDLLKRRLGGAERAIDLLIGLGAVGAIAAAWTGNAALGSIELPASFQAAAERHQDAGSLAAWIAGGAALARVFARLSESPRRGRSRSPAAGRVWSRTATLLLGLAVALTLRAGYFGGVLVHDLGVTRATLPHRAVAPPASPSTYEAEPSEEK